MSGDFMLNVAGLKQELGRRQLSKTGNKHALQSPSCPARQAARQHRQADYSDPIQRARAEPSKHLLEPSC
jgi:hypothetical protein